jgi:N-carbamoyl-L-amino-acid hydrolase
VISLDALNALTRAKFVASLDGIFEHSAWVAERAAEWRPFFSRLQLLDALRNAVFAASEEEQLALIRAHPQLGAARRQSAPLTQSSAREQHDVGLDTCTPAERARLAQLNAAYAARFGFPFVLAVRGHDPTSIIASCEQRLGHDESDERRTALAEIALIAGYRLADLVSSPAGVEILAMLGRQGERVSLIREWMLAAGMELRFQDAEFLIGYRQGSRTDGKTVLIGVRFDPIAEAVRYDGRLGFLIGIAVTQQLRQRNVRTPFAIAVIARPGDERGGDAGSLSDADAVRGCVALSATDARAADGSSTLAALRAAGLEADSLLIVRQAEQGLTYREAVPLNAHMAELAARTLEDFLLQTQHSTHLNG